MTRRHSFSPTEQDVGKGILANSASMSRLKPSHLAECADWTRGRKIVFDADGDGQMVGIQRNDGRPVEI